MCRLAFQGKQRQNQPFAEASTLRKHPSIHLLYSFKQPESFNRVRPRHALVLSLRVDSSRAKHVEGLATWALMLLLELTRSLLEEEYVSNQGGVRVKATRQWSACRDVDSKLVAGNQVAFYFVGFCSVCCFFFFVGGGGTFLLVGLKGHPKETAHFRETAQARFVFPLEIHMRSSTKS